MVGAEFGRHPAPTLHVDDDALDVGAADVLPAFGPSLQQGLAQALELHVFGMQRAEIGFGRGCRADVVQHGLGIAKVGLLVDQDADPARRQAAAAGKARIFENGEVELDLVRGLRLGARRKIRRRGQIEGVCRQPPIVGVLDLGDDGLRPRREAHAGNPERRAGARGIERLQRGEVVRRRTFADCGIIEPCADGYHDGVGRGNRGCGLGARCRSGIGRRGAPVRGRSGVRVGSRLGARRHRRRVGCALLLRCTQRRGRGAWRGDFERGGRRLLGAEHARSRQRKRCRQRDSPETGT